MMESPAESPLVQTSRDPLIFENKCYKKEINTKVQPLRRIRSPLSGGSKLVRGDRSKTLLIQPLGAHKGGGSWLPCQPTLIAHLQKIP